MKLTYDYSDYGESVLCQGRPQNRVGRRSRAEDFDGDQLTLRISQRDTQVAQVVLGLRNFIPKMALLSNFVNCLMCFLPADKKPALEIQPISKM